MVSELEARGCRRADVRVLQRMRLPGPLDFPAGSSELPPAGLAALRSAARALLEQPMLRACVGGRCSEGEPPELATARALAVRGALVAQGVQEARVSCGGLPAGEGCGGAAGELRVLELPCNAFVARGAGTWRGQRGRGSVRLE
ncbi:unnamed protein product [Prorocentrum cordatum]|uniref:OmpA-like domain-containing protein n=1 Tax=Prorocentrum cordatum TaxID=2364126 RepID=A0ABN9QW40_9DINO|nr:unnamed protein product [Polarella glacialis]